MAINQVAVGAGGNVPIIGIYNALIPPEGAKCVWFRLDFVDFQTNVLDFSQAYENNYISRIQAVYIDNSANNSPVTLANQNAPYQNVTIKAGAQGTFTLITAIRPVFSATTAGSCIVPMIFCNVPLPEGIWPSGSLASAAIVPKGPAVFTVAVGGTAVEPFGAGVTFGAGGYITNPLEATESLYVDPVNTAGTVAPGTGGTTSELTAGASYPIPAGVTGTISVNAATTGHAFTAIQWGA